MSEHELWNELGNLYFISGAYDQAIYAYHRSIELDELYGRPYSNLALAYVQKGRYTDAVELYRRSIELLSDIAERATSWNRLGDLYRQLKVYDEAVDAYQQADLLEQSKYPRSEISTELKIEEPESEVENSEKISEEDASGMTELGDSPISVSLADNELTLFSLDEVESWSIGESQPRETVVSELLGDVEETTSDQMSFKEPQVESSLLINKRQPQKVVLYPDTYELDDCRREEALNATYTDLPLVSHLEPEEEPIQINPDPYPDDADLSPSESITDEQAFAVDAESSETMDATTDKLEDDEAEYTEIDYPSDVEVNIDRFRKILQMNPRNSIAWDTLGGLYKSKGQYKEALIAFQRAISIDSSKPLYHHHLGLIYAAEGRVEDAIETLEKVIELDPEHGLALATLGGYYKKMGLDELAETHIGKAMKIIYESENEYNRACLEAICGNAEKALDLLRIALENGQTYVDWILHDPDLDFIRSDPRFKALVADYSGRATRQ